MNWPPFRSHWFLPTGHAQTLAGVYLAGESFPYRAVQHRVGVSRGDEVLIHDDQPAGWQPGQRIVLLMHGLAGSHRSPYVVRIAGRLNALGIRTVRMDLRGAGAGGTLARYSYHSGLSEDAGAVIQTLHAWAPTSPVTLAGFSLSANIALKLAGEVGAQPPGGLDSVIAVCPPVKLEECCLALRRGQRVWYDRYFVRVLLQQIGERHAARPDVPPARFASPPRSLFELDDMYTAPHGGFASARDYYTRSSAAPLVGDIRLPTLVIAADNDPVVPVRVFDDLPWPPCVEFHRTRGGGHLGFVARRNGDPDRRWMDWRVVEWIKQQGTRDVSPQTGA